MEDKIIKIRKEQIELEQLEEDIRRDERFFNDLRVEVQYFDNDFQEMVFFDSDYSLRLLAEINELIQQNNLDMLTLVDDYIDELNRDKQQLLQRYDELQREYQKIINEEDEDGNKNGVIEF